MKVQGSSSQPDAQGVERGKDGAKRAHAKDGEPGKESAFERMMRGDASETERARADDARAEASAPDDGLVGDGGPDEAELEEPEEIGASEDAEFEEPEELPDGAGALQERGMAAGEARAEATEAAEATDAPREVDAVVQEMVEACFVGEDAQARKVVMLEIALPGRGMVRARVRRERDGVSVRLRAKDPETRELLRAHKDAFVKGASERGVDLKEVDIV